LLLAAAMMFSSFASIDANAQPKKAKEKRPATEPAALQTLPDFKVELLHSADPATEGSWINMCKDNKGRFIVSGQNRQPILRFTVKDGKVEKVEKIDLPISEAMGLLYANDSLYINGAGPDGFGLYRCRPSKDGDKFENVQLLKAFSGGGEHGAHGLAIGPDKKIYVINGNHTAVPQGLSPESPHTNYKEDQLLPRQWDGNGHATGILAPGGYILRTDPEGKQWEMVVAGFRNAYDITFNADGELFTFDSDMEWDWGMPWYRPIRVNHCTSGAEFGWRSGTGKWPAYYPDSLPATVDIGVGSPTGVSNGIGAKFPAKYQKALYLCDWTYGRLIAVHLTPSGSSYKATFENFVAPAGLLGKEAKTPLNLTDVTVGDDGAMYFVTGGRNTAAGLYRVTYSGKEPTTPADLHDQAGSKERQLRHEIEAFHGKKDPKAVEFAWPHLNSDDRFMRYAARIAIESQPVADWKARALAETQPQAALTALLALSRTATREAQPELLAALDRFPLGKLSPDLQFDKLRVLGLSFIRQGRPSVAQAKRIIAELDALFPSQNELLNRELVKVLIFLESPTVAAKSLKLMAEAKLQEDLMHYLFHLRTLPIGWWTLDQRKEYFSYFTKSRKPLGHSATMEKWFADAGRGYGDGASFPKFLQNFFKEATANLSDAERKELAVLLKSIDQASNVNYEVKQRPFVKEWKMAELEAQLDKVAKGRDVNRGRDAYFAGQCIKCHRIGNEGGTVGPDLTALSSRFARRDILESIVEPSKVISDQYQNIVVNTLSGKKIIGRLMDENAESIVIQPNPLSPERVEIKKSDIDTREASKVSPMPEHLVDVLSAEEILDLIAFLESGGKKDSKPAKKK
jgi:putative heme-binding domain-containing protein